MTPFNEFTGKMERVLICAWRSVVCACNIDENMFNSVMFSMENEGNYWGYSFAVRTGSKWLQAVRRIKAFEYDIFAPNDNGQNRSYDNVASELALDILSEIREKVLELGSK